MSHQLILVNFQIVPNDKLPSLVCHKCLVFTENCMEFRDKVKQNDEKLRLIFKVNEEVMEPPPVVDTVMEVEPVEEEDEEVITLNPNTLYESSDESEVEIRPESAVEHRPVQPALASSTITNNTPPVPPQKVGNGQDKKDIFHCRFCDVVFVDISICTEHEVNNHDPVNPFECVVCSFKCDQHTTLIYHIKQEHNLDKPHLCTVCRKAFNRRSDLRKHTFVHAGVRLYICPTCGKSFTRNTNLTKHKRTHSENAKTWKCQLCPRAFYSNSDLSRHLEVHMDRTALACKHCNQAFSRRDQLELHQKTHFENNVVENPPPQQIVFYNQPPEQPILHQQPPLTTPMNFYTENMSSNPNAMQLLQPKTEYQYPIMNQLLTGLNPSMLQPVKNFVCGICGNTFFKKKELDRHVITIHTTVKQFACKVCPKIFNRKDKLVRHEKTHVNAASVFNCSLCPAVFVRKQMLDFHSKIHNGDQQGQSQLESFLASLQQPVVENNGVNHMMDVGASQQLMSAMVQSSVPESPAKLYPMNLSMSKSPGSEPINLSNDRVEPQPEVSITKVETSPARITIDSDEDNDELRIVEETPVIKKSPSLLNLFKNLPEPIEQPREVEVAPENGDAEKKPRFEDEISFAMTSRITNLDKLEPLRDLPMEILNND